MLLSRQAMATAILKSEELRLPDLDPHMICLWMFPPPREGAERQSNPHLRS